MQLLPFDIPRSLSSYLTQFENNPGKGISNLENYLKKRGMDAVGYFLLAWLYHQNGQQDNAIHYALKAKCCAPGSPLFEHLHYFLMHPRHFNAWNPVGNNMNANDDDIAAVPSGYTLDLDHLIEELSKSENKKISISPDVKDERNLGEKSAKTGDIASETLAKIYEKQEKYQEAIRTMDILQQIKPHKSDHYKSEIERLENLHQTASSEKTDTTG